MLTYHRHFLFFLLIMAFMWFGVGCCHAMGDDVSAWTKTDTALLMTAEMLILVDMSQTLQFRRQGAEEKNCVLGARPHRDRTIAFISASMILTAAIAYFSPKGFREGFLVGVIIGEGSAVYSNHVTCGCSLGIRF
jgi:hypothetical protein